MPAGAPYTGDRADPVAAPVNSWPHLVELITRDLDDRCELVEAIRIDHGPRIELPEGARVAVEYDAGASTPRVTVTILAGRVRHLDRGAVQ
jgi:hypothetical protein